MVKHSPNERLRLYQQQQQVQQQRRDMDPALQQQAAVDVHLPPTVPAIVAAAAIEDEDGTELPPVGEVLRRAAEVRAEAEEQDKQNKGFTPHPNVNTRRRRDRDPDGIHLDDDFQDEDGDGDFADSFAAGDFPDNPPPWLSQVIQAAVTAAATAVAALPARSAPRASMAPTKLSDRKVPCLLYTSPSPRDGLLSRMPSSA